MVQPMSKQYLNRNSLSRFVMCDKSILKIFWPMLMFIHFAGANPISNSFFTPALIKNIITENQSGFVPRLMPPESVDENSFRRSKDDNEVPPQTTLPSVILFDPGLDGRVEIANYNKFMDEIFSRMNLAIKAKSLDPMDLKLLPNTNMEGKAPRLERTEIDEREANEALMNDVNNVKAWLFGMSTLKRTSDVSIFFYPTHRTIQCPFALGPLELRVSKLVQVGDKQKRKTAKAITATMLGYMDFKIDRATGSAEITDVVFDEPGTVDVQGSLKRLANTKDKEESPYKLVLASKALQSLKKVARLVVGSGDPEMMARS